MSDNRTRLCSRYLNRSWEISAQLIGCVIHSITSSLFVTMRLFKLNNLSKDSRRVLPLLLFRRTKKGLLKIIEKTVPWNESVTTYSHSLKARNHSSTAGYTHSFKSTP